MQLAGEPVVGLVSLSVDDSKLFETKTAKTEGTHLMENYHERK